MKIVPWVGRVVPNPPLTGSRIGSLTRCARLSANGRLRTAVPTCEGGAFEGTRGHGDMGARGVTEDLKTRGPEGGNQGRAGCPQPAVDPNGNRVSHEVRTSIRERTAEDSRPYLAKTKMRTAVVVALPKVRDRSPAPPAAFSRRSESRAFDLRLHAQEPILGRDVEGVAVIAPGEIRGGLAE